MPVGEFVDSMAERAEHKSCKKGYTGFMNGAAASIIASAWARGEEFRKWYNLKTQFGTEGEDANEKEGAILNPALMSIG